MNRSLFRAALALSVAGVAIASVANGQVLSRANVANWTNSRGDAQHSGWQRSESPSGGISVADVKGAKSNYSSPELQPGFGLQIKHKMDNTSANLASLSAGVTLSAAGLGTNMGFFGASNNRTIGVDMDTGQAWFTHVYEDPAPAGSIDCPGATMAAPARPANAAILAPPGPPVPPPAPTALPYGTYTSAPGEGLPKQRPAQGGPVALGDAGAAAGGGRAGAPAGGGGRAGAPAGGGGAGRAGAPAAAAAAPAARAPVVYGVAGALQRGTGGGAAAPSSGNTYTVSNDGKIHTLTDWYGLDVYAPAPFLPAGAQPTDLIAVDDVVYASTINSCHGTANGVYGVTVTSALPRGQGSAAAAGGGFGGAPAPAAPAAPSRPLGQVTSWLTGGTSSPSALSFVGAVPPAGPAGPAAPSFLGAPTPVAIGPAATTAIVATTAGTGQYANSIVALNVPNLTVKSAFTLPGADFVTAPTLFPSGTRLIGAVQSRDGRIFLVDTSDLSKPLLVTAPVSNLGGYKPAGLASWEDPSGQRWLLSTTANSVIGYKVSINGATATLTQGWVLTGLKSPLAPVIVNGVVFAASSGEFIPAKGATASIAARVKASTPGVLYALDGVTGEKLWNSGKAITSFIPHTSGLWVSMGQVGLADYNSNFYTFGTTMERPSNLMRD